MIMDQAHCAAGRRFLAAATVLGLLLSGCANRSELRRTAPESTCTVNGIAHPSEEDGFGCATAANLSLSVAYPEDLESPQDLAPAQGDAATDPARRHRLDQLKPLPDTVPTESEGQ